MNRNTHTILSRSPSENYYKDNINFSGSYQDTPKRDYIQKVYEQYKDKIYTSLVITKELQREHQ